MYIEFDFIRKVKVGIVYKIPYRRARAWPSASREQRYIAYKGRQSSVATTLCHASRLTRYHARHESDCLKRVSSSTTVYEFRLTAARVTGLDDGCYACVLV